MGKILRLFLTSIIALSCFGDIQRIKSSETFKKISSSTSGGTVTDATISMSDITTNNVSNTKHGFAPKLTTANYKAFIDAAGTAMEYAKGFKILSHTRAMNGVDGSVSYTGYGFKPSLIFIYAHVWTTSSAPNAYCVTLGFDDGATRIGIFHYNPTVNMSYDPKSFAFYDSSGGKYQTGYISSFDADGYTITWNTTGDCNADTINIYVCAFR